MQFMCNLLGKVPMTLTQREASHNGHSAGSPSLKRVWVWQKHTVSVESHFLRNSSSSRNSSGARSSARPPSSPPPLPNSAYSLAFSRATAAAVICCTTDKSTFATLAAASPHQTMTAKYTCWCPSKAKCKMVLAVMYTVTDCKSDHPVSAWSSAAADCHAILSTGSFHNQQSCLEFSKAT